MPANASRGIVNPRDPAAVRARLRNAGIDVPDRGRIGKDHMAEFDRLTAEDLAAAEAAGELGEVTTTAAGGPRPEAEAPEAEAPGQVEVRPSRPRARNAPGKGLAARVREAGRGRSKGSGGRSKARSKAARPAHPRVSVAGVIQWGWGIGARAAAPLSAYLSQCLAIQAPVAGLVLEDQVRGTVADRVLQPLARGQAHLEGVGALVLMPMAIAGLEASEGLPEPKRSVRRAILVPMALEGAALWVRIAGPKVEQLIAEERERGPLREQAAALLLSMEMPFLTPADLGMAPPNGQAPGGPGPQADDVASAQGFAG